MKNCALCGSGSCLMKEMVGDDFNPMAILLPTSFGFATFIAGSHDSLSTGEKTVEISSKALELVEQKQKEGVWKEAHPLDDRISEIADSIGDQVIFSGVPTKDFLIGFVHAYASQETVNNLPNVALMVPTATNLGSFVLSAKSQEEADKAGALTLVLTRFLTLALGSANSIDDVESQVDSLPDFALQKFDLQKFIADSARTAKAQIGKVETA